LAFLPEVFVLGILQVFDAFFPPFATNFVRAFNIVIGQDSQNFRVFLSARRFEQDKQVSLIRLLRKSR
jgi:hypothetical protein